MLCSPQLAKINVFLAFRNEAANFWVQFRQFFRVESLWFFIIYLDKWLTIYPFSRWIKNDKNGRHNSKILFQRLNLRSFFNRNLKFKIDPKYIAQIIYKIVAWIGSIFIACFPLFILLLKSVLSEIRIRTLSSSSFPPKKQASDWLTYLVYQLEAIFLPGKPLEPISWLGSQKNWLYYTYTVGIQDACVQRIW